MWFQHTFNTTAINVTAATAKAPNYKGNLSVTLSEVELALSELTEDNNSGTDKKTPIVLKKCSVVNISHTVAVSFFQIHAIINQLDR